MEADRKQHVTTVFFDLGNTLVASNGHGKRVLRQAATRLVRRLIKLGHHLDEKAVTELLYNAVMAYQSTRDSDLFEITTEKLLGHSLAQAGYGDISQKDIVAGLEAYYGYTQALWEPESDAHDALANLDRTGIAVGIITNASYAWDVQCLIDKLKIRTFISQITISAEVGVRKPHPEIFHHALKALKCKPDNALMVGDNLIADVLGASKIGMRTAWLIRRANQRQMEETQRWVKPDFLLHSLAEVPDLIQYLNQ